MPTSRFCERCGEALSSTAKFCPGCGRALNGGSTGAGEGRATRLLPWLVPSAAVALVLAIALYSSSERAPAAGAFPVGSAIPASDISALTPEERVDRLFNRVMAAAEAGKADSVAFFAPMALNSFEALRPLTPHRHYDLGLIQLVSGEPALARAAADSILAVAPRHLLGLALAMRAATASGDEPARARHAATFRAVLTAERARALPEYVDHAADIDDAVARVEGRRTAGAPRGIP